MILGGKGRKGRVRLAAIAVAALVAAGAIAYRTARPDWPPADPGPISSAHLKDVTILTPDRPPVGLAAIVSGGDRSDAAERDLEARLRERGFIVLALDAARWRSALDAGPQACIRPIVDVELLAKEAQRALGLDRYLGPILIGRDGGGALTAAILSRALPATLSGGVAIDPAPTVPGAKPICDDDAPVAPPDPGPGGFRYPLPARTQAALTIVSGEAAADAPHEPGYGPHAIAYRSAPDRDARVTAAVEAALATALQDAGSSDLPVVDLPAQGRPRALALFLSGDGGWRDIDKRIGEQLAQDGIHVVGLDALRYFWRERDPKATAADLARMLHEADPAGTLPVLVLGYSFGADLFPFSWPHWPDALQGRTRLIALLGPNCSTGFSVTVTGWLGYGGAHAVVPRIADLPLARVLCVHGSDEPDSACTDPALAPARRVAIPGGHHFDRDYPAIARLILREAGLAAPGEN